MKRYALLLVLLAAGASAHAVPAASEPAGGARLDEPPAEVWVAFTEPVYAEGTWIRVLDVDGNRVDADDLRMEFGARPVLTISTPDLPDGSYRIAWQTYSQSDGHTIRGSIGFAVGGFAPPETSSVNADAVEFGPALARLFLYAGLVAGIGARVVHYVLHRDPSLVRRTGMIAGGLVVTGVGALIILNAATLGFGVSYLNTAGGRELLFRLIVGGILIAAAAKQWQAWQTVGWAAVAIDTARFGHITVDHRWGVALESVHLIAASAWLGGLLFLTWFLLQPNRFNLSSDQAMAAGQRFSKVATWAMAAVVVSGLLTTWLLYPDMFRGQASGPWAQFLRVKIIATVIVLALAALNHFVFLDRPGKTRPRGATRLRRAAAAEGGLGILILVAASFLLSLSPPQDEPATFDGLQWTAVGTDHLLTLQLAPVPAANGTSAIAIFIADADGPVRGNTCSETRDDCIVVLFGRNGSLDERVLRPDGDGWWRSENLFWQGPGNYTIEVIIQTATVWKDPVATGFGLQANGQVQVLK